MVSVSFIVNIIKKILFITLFIVFIPDFFFEIPKGGSKIGVAALHGLIYSLLYVLIEVIFSMKRIIMCSASGGMGSV
jgi:hypothetical protein